jgi:hypothetical protein
MKMTQANSGRMNTLFRAGLGGALLALTSACGGEMDAASDGFEGEREHQGSEVVDEFASEDALEAERVIEKATFNDSLTYNGFNVACTTTPNQKQLIRDAEVRARQILDTAMAENASARVNRTTTKAGRFRTYFIPDGNTNPDPNRTSPDAWDTASFRVGQKLAKVSEVLASAVHTCHGPNESYRQLSDGTFQTCSQLPASASTDFEGGAENAIRWCDVGLAQSLNGRAVTLLHELTHQDRTADARGVKEGRVIDDNSTGRLNNAQNYSSWFIVNQP